MKPKFSGELAEPLTAIFRGGLIGTGPCRDTDVQKRVETESRKLSLLATHYGVEHADLNTQTLFVALALAREFVPGFKVADPNKKNGRPQVWTEIREAFLVVEMEREIEFRHHDNSASEAAKKLAKRKPWSTLCERAGSSDEPAEALRARYFRAKKKNNWAAILRQSLAYERLPENESEKLSSYEQMLNSLSEDFPVSSYY